MAATNGSSRKMQGYFQVTRTFTYSVLFVLPLLLIYEVGIMIINQRYPVRNGADVILQQLLYSYGEVSFYGFTALMLAGLLATFLRERKRYHLQMRKSWFAGMLMESVLYAFLLGGVSMQLTQAVLPGLSILLQLPPAPQTQGLGTQIVLSLGAGIYEEFVFRVLLVSGLYFVVRRLAGSMPSWAGYAVSAVIAAFIFSAFHYVGALGDPFSMASFTFRFMAGLVLNALYITRGFGIAVWAHALYDVRVSFVLG